MKTKNHSKATKHKDSKSPKSAGLSKRAWIVIVSAVVALVALAGGLMVFYSGRAMPNVKVGNVAVSNAAPATIRHAISQQTPALRITFDDGGKKTTVPAKDLGVVVDVEATVSKVLNARRDPAQALQLWQTVEVPLVLANDAGVLIEYAHAHFPSVFADATEPKVEFDAGSSKFVVTPGKPGKGLDIKSFERALPDLAKRPQNFTLKLTSSSVQPLLDESKLAKVADAANARIAQKIEFKLDGDIIYTAKPAEIASWLHFVAEPTAGTVRMEVDKAKIQQFLTDQVGPTVASPPVDRKVIVDSQSGTQTVLQEGRTGSQLSDLEQLAGDVVATVNGNRALTRDVSITKAPFKTVTVSGSGKWIEVDLSKQRLTMYLGNQVVLSTLVSTGRAATPTQVGEFAIYSKRAVMTMTGTIAGDYYYIPNIKWVSFFDGGEAFHGTYWHHNFGHPMSHGCVNMTEADAKKLYDFAPIGTKVVVHY